MFSRDVLLLYHLQQNHYPPVSVEFAATAVEAISAAECDDWDRVVTLPTGKRMTVSEIVDELHLSSFITTDEEIGI